jgi:predicted PurR-regulated permease PerM
LSKRSPLNESNNLNKSKNMKNETNSDHFYRKRAVKIALSLGFLALLISLSYGILRPFIALIVWGIVIAVGVYPLHLKLKRGLGNRAKLSAVLISIIGLSVIAVPVALFTSSTVDSIKKTVESIENESLEVPPPNEKLKEWPLIGESAYSFWSSANQNLEATFQKYKPQLLELTPKLTKAVTGMVGGLVQFILSIIIAGVFLTVAEPGRKITDQIFRALAGPRGALLTPLSIDTIRSVVNGVIGIAVIQTLFISLGFFLIHLPAAGVVAIVLLIVAIAQIPPMLITIPVILYVFSYADTTPAIIFAVWTFLWSLADNILKPMLLGKGVDVPMLVILLGAIGGMIMGGMVGLFVGSVVLALTYKIMMSIIEQTEKDGIEEG